MNHLYLCVCKCVFVYLYLSVCKCVFVYLYLSRLVGRHLYSLMNNSANLHFNAIKLSRFKTLRKDFKKYKQLKTYVMKYNRGYTFSKI